MLRKLKFLDFTKTFSLTTDASNKALRAILSQGEIGKDLPICYASRTLNKSESNYSTTELECRAIIFGVKQFRLYLYHRKFIILSDRSLPNAYCASSHLFSPRIT